MRKIDPELRERLQTLISSMGYELVGCELVMQGRQTVFRIYIDTETGVNLDDCSNVSHQVSAMMDVEDSLQGRYNLEVSSPGIDRPLFEIEHYRRFIGSTVKVKLYAPLLKQRQYKGELKRVEGEDVYLLAESTGHEVKLSFSNIEKGNLIGDVGFRDQNSQKSGIKGRRKKILDG